MHQPIFMRAVVIDGPRRARLETTTAPEPAVKQVRVRLQGCGVCGSNLPPWEGRPWFKYPMAPGELGHEGWGIVDAVGPGVTQIHPGDRVAMLSYRAYAEYDVAPEDAVVRLPASLDGQPFPGEALGCAMNVFRRCEIYAGQTVAILGVGFLGAVLASLSVNAGARVIAISRRPFALEVARRLGAEHTISIADPRAVIDQVRDLTGGLWCDRVIEATGLQGPLDLAGEITRERGQLIIAGYHQDGLRQVNMQLWNWRGIDVINAHERDSQVYLEGMRLAVEAVVNGDLDPTPLYTHRFGLDQVGQALDTMRERPDNFLKAIIQL